jgi:hypothetical protein
MDISWSKVIEQAVGIILGGGITVFGIWAKEFFENRKSAQVWYEQAYIAEGIDRLLAYLKIKQIQLTRLLATRQLIEMKGGLPPLGLKEILPSHEPSEIFPLESLVRLEILLKIPDITASVSILNDNVILFRSMPPENRSLALMQSTVTRLQDTYNHLEELRETLLDIKVKRKSDIHKIKDNQKVITTLANLRRVYEEWLAKTAERSGLIRKGK